MKPETKKKLEKAYRLVAHPAKAGRVWAHYDVNHAKEAARLIREALEAEVKP